MSHLSSGCRLMSNPTKKGIKSISSNSLSFHINISLWFTVSLKEVCLKINVEVFC